ncbi:MAG: S41 family peptidase [Myxococcota bacterium]|nr:S41 family peptidase [Myxococcota bacterium]
MKTLQSLRFLALACALAAPVAASSADLSWREKAERDLAALKVAIEDSHPGSIDPENPGFRVWLNEGYIKARQKLAQVETGPGYAAVMRYYVNGFKDVHLQVKLSGVGKLRTPGFMVKLDKGGEYVVANRINLESKVPPIGSKLLSCDGKSAMMLASENLDPYFTVTQLNAHRWMAAPYLLVDDGNPFVSVPSRCIFQTPELGEQPYVLQWSDVSGVAADNAVSGILDWNPNLGVRKLGNRGYWITVPTLLASSDNPLFHDLIADIEKNVKAIRTSEVLVIDVRSNAGGYHPWGTAIAYAIWGESYVKRRAPDAVLDARVSAANASFLGTPEAKKESAAFAKLEGSNRSLGEELRAAYDAKRPWVTFPIYPTAKPKARLTDSPVKGKVVLLTDSWCTSACLMFADLLFELGDVMHVGQPTNADTLYTGVRKQKLESKHASLTLPTEVFRRRKRGSNQTYVPRHVFRGEMSDTYELERWILKLTQPEPKTKVASSRDARATTAPSRRPVTGR